MLIESRSWNIHEAVLKMRNFRLPQSFAITFFLFLSCIVQTMPLSYAVDKIAPSYRIGPEDVLQVSVWKDESLKREVVVRMDGFISFPLAGELLAQGKTVDQFVDDIKEKLSEFIPDPPVTVAVLQGSSNKIYVIGKVNRPGEFLVGHHTDVIQALSLAGGLTPYASKSNIKVLRRIGEDQVVFPFDYGDVIHGDDLAQNIILHRWDVVMVP